MYQCHYSEVYSALGPWLVRHQEQNAPQSMLNDRASLPEVHRSAIWESTGK